MLRPMLLLDQVVEVGLEDPTTVEDMVVVGSEEAMTAVDIVEVIEVIETAATVVAEMVEGMGQERVVGMIALMVITIARGAVTGMVAEAPGTSEEEVIGRGIAEGMEETETGMVNVMVVTVMTVTVFGVVTILGNALTMESLDMVENPVVVVTRLLSLSPFRQFLLPRKDRFYSSSVRISIRQGLLDCHC
ncbi:hypothetical protein BJ508DRAFT_125781 [Ascobolus immersus RN42]|uniref:Uncharacterized protein n=1 Tax=Ascobolus immersus RN42 TaxID=1160509 RepID=A0A3N4I3T1_ASCIM|nr:hypothetical protein BJ508DRAFT_125781 [Ascobolus immersus RN42]